MEQRRHVDQEVDGSFCSTEFGKTTVAPLIQRSARDGRQHRAPHSRYDDGSFDLASARLETAAWITIDWPRFRFK